MFSTIPEIDLHMLSESEVDHTDKLIYQQPEIVMHYQNGVIHSYTPSVLAGSQRSRLGTFHLEERDNVATFHYKTPAAQGALSIPYDLTNRPRMSANIPALKRSYTQTVEMDSAASSSSSSSSSDGAAERIAAAAEEAATAARLPPRPESPSPQAGGEDYIEEESSGMDPVASPSEDADVAPSSPQAGGEDYIEEESSGVLQRIIAPASNTPVAKVPRASPNHQPKRITRSPGRGMPMLHMSHGGRIDVGRFEDAHANPDALTELRSMFSVNTGDVAANPTCDRAAQLEQAHELYVLTDDCYMEFVAMYKKATGGCAGPLAPVQAAQTVNTMIKAGQNKLPSINRCASIYTDDDAPEELCSAVTLVSKMYVYQALIARLALDINPAEEFHLLDVFAKKLNNMSSIPARLKRFCVSYGVGYPADEALLNKRDGSPNGDVAISCQCKGGCSLYRCSCIRAGVPCSAACHAGLKFDNCRDVATESEFAKIRAQKERRNSLIAAAALGSMQTS